MPEGDTIHRIAARFEATMVGGAIARAEAPNPRSPLHRRVDGIAGRTLERAEARGKHLLLHLSGGLVVHNHLGMNGRWWLGGAGEEPRGRPWLALVTASGSAALRGSKILRVVSAARARNDPVLISLGPDPLADGFDHAAATARLLGWEPSEAIGSALLDQRLLAGVGNVIRVEALWRAKISPWRKVGDVEPPEAEAVVTEAHAVMVETVRTGRRPKRIYGELARRPCPRCGGPIVARGQGDDNRLTYWCERCQA